MATDKNIIKNWFRNGLKPTQEQFWAWQDSFYHKSDKIPQTQIEGLDGSLANKADVSQLEGKADLIDGKVPESQLPLLKDNTKVDKPTIDGNWVVNKTEDVISWVSADSFGKNMANSQLVTTVGAGVTQGANYTWDTAGYYLYFKGLPDKSNDATFNKMVVIDSNGQMAESNGKVLIKSIPSLLSEAERRAWKTEMNGGWTTNTMSVALISPFIIKNDNNDNWILLKGANLNLNPTSFEVAIMDEMGTSVLTIVPNNQVQLYTNGTDLIFYYNFSTLGLGKYKIRLWNGVAHYTTNGTITISNTISNIPFQQGEIRLVSGSSSTNIATADEVILKPDSNIKAQPTTALRSLSDIVSNWVDGNVLQGNEDWWVQLGVECVVTSSGGIRVDIANVGLSSSSSSSLLSPTIGGVLINNIPTGHFVSQNSDIGIIGGGTLNDLANGSQINYIKIGSILQTLIIASNGTIVSSATTIDTSKTYRLVSNCNNQPDNNNYQAGIKLSKLRMSNI
ncbi:hypothetical protein [Riemerella anatipestifer]|uniref:hypothetical protein n=1 Tax=Riemerella anatipestifer TaxID=34085 RepID=UPI003DA8DF4E